MAVNGEFRVRIFFVERLVFNCVVSIGKHFANRVALVIQECESMAINRYQQLIGFLDLIFGRVLFADKIDPGEIIESDLGFVDHC